MFRAFLFTRGNAGADSVFTSDTCVSLAVEDVDAVISSNVFAEGDVFFRVVKCWPSLSSLCRGDNFTVAIIDKVGIITCCYGLSFF